MIRSNWLAALLAVCLCAIIAPDAKAVSILGTGTGALLGGDLTDPEDDGAADADVNYNATFASDDEPGFGGGEFSFNVFDNQVGGGNAKWCCNDPSPGGGDGFNLDATLDAGLHHLTHFTVTSSNDSPPRDPITWGIAGSKDGINFDTIFFQDAPTALWTARNQVLRFDAGVDFAVQTKAYNTFRYFALESGNTTQHALNEIEYFGTAFVPEPATLSLLAIAGAGMLKRRRRLA